MKEIEKNTLMEQAIANLKYDYNISDYLVKRESSEIPDEFKEHYEMIKRALVMNDELKYGGISWETRRTLIIPEIDYEEYREARAFFRDFIVNLPLSDDSHLAIRLAHKINKEAEVAIEELDWS